MASRGAVGQGRRPPTEQLHPSMYFVQLSIARPISCRHYARSWLVPRSLWGPDPRGLLVWGPVGCWSAEAQAGAYQRDARPHRGGCWTGPLVGVHLRQPLQLTGETTATTSTGHGDPDGDDAGTTPAATTTHHGATSHRGHDHRARLGPPPRGRAEHSSPAQAGNLPPHALVLMNSVIHYSA